MSSDVVTPPGTPLPSIVVDHATSTRVEPPRRADLRVRKTSSQTVQALAPVPEDSSSHPRPSLLPGPPSNATARRSSSWKGKENENTRIPGLSRGVSGESVQSSRRRRADWVVDLLETRKGSEAWVEGDRVVLVTGSISVESLEPILYNPAFATTLLIIGSTSPIPTITALLSPSHLSSSPDRTIYPTLQPFTLYPSSENPHPLLSILTHATSLAHQYRERSTTSSKTWSRGRGSSDSLPSATPPSTPPTQKRKPSNLGFGDLSRRNSSESNDGSASPQSGFQTPPRLGEIPKSASGHSLSAMRRLSSYSRDTSSGGMGKQRPKATDSKGKPINRSPFDAVINFIPRASDFAPDRALQSMLHQVAVLTSGVIPIAKSRETATLDVPISLLHVLPDQVPGPLPAVIESFLLSLLPSVVERGVREVWGGVVTTPAWLAPNVDGSEAIEQTSGAEVLLFGGLRCPYPILEDVDQVNGVKLRGFLPNWGTCKQMPGSLAEARRPSNLSRPASQRRAESMANANGDRDGESVPPLELGGYTSAQLEIRSQPSSATCSPRTPVSDMTHSATSSWSGSAEMASTGSEVEQRQQQSLSSSDEKGKKTLSGWLKARSKGIRT